MLVLTRRVGEVIVVDNEIQITVLSIAGGKIRLGIAAPPSISVDRAEIHERKTREVADEPALVGAVS
jgi:carbon storage regulator